LIDHIAALMTQRGVSCRREQVFVTTGAQQALDVLTRLLLDPGGAVILEEIAYTGIQQAIAPLQATLLTVATDLDQGMDVDAVAAYLVAGHRPAYIYAIPEAHNPLGVSLDRQRRKSLVSLASHYGVPIVEDDPYGFLTYEEEAPPPLRATDGPVFYVGSFSKILAPALRLGWIVAPESLLPQLTVVKEAADLETSALTQRAVAAFLDSGQLPAHIGRLRAAYKERRDTMLSALTVAFPAEARWTHPRGGMFIWVELPTHINTMALLDVAVADEKVAFVPGRAFALPGVNADNCLRLNFSNASCAQIEAGITRLARAVHRFL
jgi:2-aminoadipate transaminase